MKKDKLLLTGASSGIGYSLMNHLSKRFHVIAIARNIDRIKGINNVTPYKLDLLNREAVSDCFDRIIKEHGYIPYLINNAGVMVKSDVLDLNEEILNESFYVNAFMPLFIMQKLLPAMQMNNYGRIINVTSGAPLNCSESFSAYSASKASLNAFTVTAAKENSYQDIKINLMSPGPCRTKMAPTGTMEASVCHPTVDYLLSIKKAGPTGEFFWLGNRLPLYPELKGINWMEGKADERYREPL